MPSSPSPRVRAATTMWSAAPASGTKSLTPHSLARNSRAERRSISCSSENAKSTRRQFRAAPTNTSADLRRPCSSSSGSAPPLLARASTDALAPLLVASPESEPPGSPNISPRFLVAALGRRRIRLVGRQLGKLLLDVRRQLFEGRLVGLGAVARRGLGGCRRSRLDLRSRFGLRERGDLSLHRRRLGRKQRPPEHDHQAEEADEDRHQRKAGGEADARILAGRERLAHAWRARRRRGGA